MCNQACGPTRFRDEVINLLNEPLLKLSDRCIFCFSGDLYGWAGARELVDSSYQPTYVVLEGHNPIPSALSCTFLRPTGRPPQSSRETGEPREFPSPYIPLGLQLGLESSVRGYFHRSDRYWSVRRTLRCNAQRRDGPVQGSLLIQAINRHTSCSGGPQPHPLRLVMHLPAGQPAGHLNLQGKRANHVNSRPLTSPLGYNSVWNRVRGYFPQGLASIFARLRRCDPGSNLGPPVRRRTP